jgi:antitoxin component of RelBE/YafQ-DinJ toxin-antitoxin module
MSDTPAAPPSGNSSNAPAGGAAPTTNAAPVAPPKPLKIRDLEFKSEDEAYREVERGRQSGKLLNEAQKRLHEASRKEKDFESLISEVKTKKDARKVIERLGLSKEEAVEVFGRYIYEEEVRPRDMDPKDRRIRELEAQAAQAAEERQSKEKAAKDEEFQNLTKQEEGRLKAELSKLLQDKKVPSTRLALRRLANYMASYAEAGADVPADRAADMVMEDYRQEFGELFEEASADQLSEFFGKQRWHMLARKVSEWALSRARPGGNIAPAVKNAVQARATKAPEEKMTPQDFQNLLRKLK